MCVTVQLWQPHLNSFNGDIKHMSKILSSLPCQDSWRRSRRQLLYVSIGPDFDSCLRTLRSFRFSDLSRSIRSWHITNSFLLSDVCFLTSSSSELSLSIVLFYILTFYFSRDRQKCYQIFFEFYPRGKHRFRAIFFMISFKSIAYKFVNDPE